jgi:hypothetical protein
MASYPGRWNSSMLKVFEKGVLRKIFAPERESGTNRKRQTPEI